MRRSKQIVCIDSPLHRSQCKALFIIILINNIYKLLSYIINKLHGLCIVNLLFFIHIFELNLMYKSNFFFIILGLGILFLISLTRKFLLHKPTKEENPAMDDLNSAFQIEFILDNFDLISLHLKSSTSLEFRQLFRLIIFIENLAQTYLKFRQFNHSL